MAGDDPLPGIKHGQSGYQKHGCRCFVCRRGKADAQARFRAKQRGEGVGAIPEGMGPVEASTRAVVDACGPQDDAGAALADVTVMHARLLDSIPETGRWHLLSATTRTWRELMGDLAALSKTAQVQDDDDFLKSLRPLGLPKD
ncbi:hypothetical protein FBY33_3629 [Arthrobacter sp. SLBN-112]|uniref:hypothetical protein n=1 Tax=Arthrobacter sp. SLBN-112 TaxID=2768452 RepID=UPI001153F8AA|nr:hypothetical protein [Arthrobacter sp. SLBN-112]TQJ41514.1 hypothetical protein FBY33_3629 [Arthrobacter sp. SLBN-112]